MKTRAEAIVRKLFTLLEERKCLREDELEAGADAHNKYAAAGMFRKLSPEEEEKFRQWARTNWKPGMPVNPTWHPVVHSEIGKILAVHVRGESSVQRRERAESMCPFCQGAGCFKCDYTGWTEAKVVKRDRVSLHEQVYEQLVEYFDSPESVKTELELYARNTSSLYNQFLSIIANVKRRIKNGTYDPNLAPKLWSYWVDEAAKAYAKEHGGPGADKSMFPKKLRDELAAEIAKDEFEKIKDGEYD